MCVCVLLINYIFIVCYMVNYIDLFSAIPILIPILKPPFFPKKPLLTMILIRCWFSLHVFVGPSNLTW